MNTTGDQQLVKRINRSVLLRLTRARPGLSRAQLAEASGLTKSTVSLLTRDLLAEGWLREARSAVASGLGRPSTPLYIDAEARALIGVEIAVEWVRVVGVSLLGEVLCTHEEASINHAPGAMCTQAAALVARVHQALVQRGLQVSGIGVGVPGAIDEATGRVRFAPNLGWRELDLLPLLARALKAAGVPAVPVHLQNEADVAALGEYEFSEAANTGPLIFVSCDVGVGAGIVLNDCLFTGAQGMAGEIGHTVLQIDGPLCSCGRRGCAEAFFGSRALARPRAMARAGASFGVLLQNLWMAFDPSCIVVGGGSNVRHPALLQHALATLSQYSASAGIALPTVRAARYGLQAAAVGAAALMLHRQLRPLQGGAGTAALGFSS
jgi:predicted NBD/HSP70 family sugar kinase